jgi:O-antigen ligase
VHADAGLSSPQQLAPRRPIILAFEAPLLILALVAFSLFTGWNVARGSMLMAVPLALAILAVYSTVRPDLLFVGWLAIAPFLQESARATPVGWVLTNVFYVLPIGVLLIRMTRSNNLARNLAWYDTVPALYVCMNVLSQGMVDALVLRQPGFYTELLHDGVLVGPPLYYICAFGPLQRLVPRHFCVALLTTCAVSGALGIYEHFTHWNLWGAPEIRDVPGDPLRIVGTLSNVHVLGAFFGSGIVMAIAILGWNGPRRLRQLSIVTLVLTLPALFFTYTRGGIAATLLVSVLLVALRPRLRVAAGLLAVLTAFVVWFSWGQVTSNHLYQQRLVEAYNVQGREAQNQAALHLASERPIFGWGYGQYDEVKNSKMPYAGPLSTSVYKYTSHNTYLTILVELGIVGLTLAFLPWVLVVGSTIRRFSSMPYPQWYTLSLLAIIGVVVLTAQTTDMRFFSFVPSLAWCCVGLLRRGLWARATPA